MASGLPAKLGAPLLCDLSDAFRMQGITLGAALHLARGLCDHTVQAHVTCVRMLTACLAAWAHQPCLVARCGLPLADATAAAAQLRWSLQEGSSAKVVGATLDGVARLAADGKLF